MQAFLQKIFVRWLTRGLFKVIEDDDVLRISGNKAWYKGKELDADAIIVLQEQSEAFLKSRLWKMLDSEIRSKAQENLYNAKSSPDLIASHVMLYNLKLFETKLKQIESIGNSNRK